ncbi:MAG: aldo/keto reductase [Candidatus Binataceae bacterium]
MPPVSIERRILGRTGLRVSALGFGGSETGYGGTSPEDLARILNDALDSGLNLIDTAACYGDGEAQLGAAISHRRKDVILATKCGHAAGLAGDDWDSAMIAKSIDRSLKRLRTDYVDIMQFHSPDAATLDDPRVLEVLAGARAAGKTRFIAVSADGASALKAIELGIFDTLQISVSIADQEAIDVAIPKAHARGMGIIAKRPLANAAWRADSRDAYSAPYRERLDRLRYGFLQGANTAAIALRFTLSVPGIACAIVGTTKPGRWAENADSLAAGPLAADQYEAIRARWRQVAPPTWTGQR